MPFSTSYLLPVVLFSEVFSNLSNVSLKRKLLAANSKLDPGIDLKFPLRTGPTAGVAVGTDKHLGQSSAENDAPVNPSSTVGGGGGEYEALDSINESTDAARLDDTNGRQPRSLIGYLPQLKPSARNGPNAAASNDNPRATSMNETAAERTKASKRKVPPTDGRRKSHKNVSDCCRCARNVKRKSLISSQHDAATKRKREAGKHERKEDRRLFAFLNYRKAQSNKLKQKKLGQTSSTPLETEKNEVMPAESEGNSSFNDPTSTAANSVGGRSKFAKNGAAVESKRSPVETKRAASEISPNNARSPSNNFVDAPNKVVMKAKKRSSSVAALDNVVHGLNRRRDTKLSPSEAKRLKQLEKQKLDGEKSPRGPPSRKRTVALSSLNVPEPRGLNPRRDSRHLPTAAKIMRGSARFAPACGTMNGYPIGLL